MANDSKEHGREAWKLVPVEPTEEMIQAACLKQSKVKFASYEEWLDSHSSGVSERIRDLVADDYRAMLAAATSAPALARDEAGVAKLAVWYGPMPESNGKTNWTAILHKGDLAEGHTIDRSEYPDRVRYAADCVRYLIGELPERPWILDYDADKHSDYVAASSAATVSDAAVVLTDEAMKRDADRYRWLRDQGNSLETRQRDKGIVNGPSCYHDVEGIRELKWGVALDEAIDAARAQSNPGG